ncbi:MAG: hypothetical protein ACREQD_00035, partial [Candidatus Binataceae bacterium]
MERRSRCRGIRVHHPVETAFMFVWNTHYARWLDELRDPFKEGRYASVEQLASMLRMRNPRLTPDASEFIARAWSRPASSASGEGGGPREGAASGAGCGSEVLLRFDPRHRLVNPVLYRRDEAQA